MNDDDYHAFLGYVFDTHVRPRLNRASNHLHHGPMGSEFAYELERMRHTSQLTQFIQAFSEHDDEIYSTFRPERLRQVVYDVSNELRRSNRLLEDSGFIDALDAHYDEIVDGLTPEHFPQEELQLLRAFGSEDPQRDLRAFIFILKSRRARRQGDRMRIRVELSRVEKQVSNEADAIRGDGEIPPDVRKPRRWFKGLGQIAQGTALSLADVGLAIGVLHFPVSPETQTWGALVSVTTGVGMVLAGAGDLRGE